jgi:hypothetical protein
MQGNTGSQDRGGIICDPPTPLKGGSSGTNLKLYLKTRTNPPLRGQGANKNVNTIPIGGTGVWLRENMRVRGGTYVKEMLIRIVNEVI